MTLSNGFYEYARVDIAAEALPAALAMVPSTMKLVGSVVGPGGAASGTVRLVFDVTHTDLPGGEWTGVFTVKGGTLTATWGLIETEAQPNG